ncbi:MAG: choice-of-anchor J domain-containing protein [Flavobacteriales bacterium]|nr:choice-of-anchor J domain-containing protein [Flavobacteriales bacterium]
MRPLKFLPLFAVLAMVSVPSFSQDRTCGAAFVNNEQLTVPEKAAIAAQLDREAAEYTEAYQSGERGVVRVIPIVFHIIHNYGPENVSKEQVLDAVRIINEDFRGLNPDLSMIVPEFMNITGDSEIEFRLAKKDPNGNCTDGITRTVSSLTFSAGENVKDLISWNTSRYLNVWVVANIESGAGGYAYYPGNAPSQSQEGIVVRNGQLGSIGTSGGSNFSARTLSHEIGHYMNLRHVWGNSNENALPDNCSEDDNVDDTPNTIGSDQTCNLNQISCGSLDNVQNYMDYSTCARMFTEGQSARMQSALQSSAGQRNNLWTNANRINTGTNDGFDTPCTPNVEFRASNTLGCEGIEVQFTDESWGADQDQTWSWNWSFPGGTPSSSIEQNPVVTYDVAGSYNATLTISSGAGSDSQTQSDLIMVNELTGGSPAPYSEGMETNGWPTQSGSEWIVEAGGGTTWQRNISASATGSASARINLRVIESGVLNSLISPAIDMSNVSAADARLTFKVAHAPRNSDGHTERLRVYASIDCGETWQIRYTRAGNQLGTTNGSTVSGTFTPAFNQWREENVNLSSVAGQPHVMFKFEAMSDGQNYLYLDDINIAAGLTSMAEQSVINSVNVFPNPLDGRSVLSIESAVTSDARITVTDAIGRTLSDLWTPVAAGSNSLPIGRVTNIPSAGIYFLTVAVDGHGSTVKLVK